ncbi:helix-turn-helix transcriptional regulator [Photorhabdus temperata]|uniref:Response regulator containing a CheY-like receiver n=2 Tax=Photorhabdus khanii TaxID=1004150 RepID=W3V5N4_9GAMM|nr:LuxR C-terminal-related transcriptional regulator [Photorhabdus khanii]ETS31147.1 response regulator containing a CheY-like receiver [Photorhabdus khanii NC19]MQL47524.1 PAS domain-containing protein [Photorhabdus khanii]OHV55988.1 helix-turn-helix transcriptional regulator [Photorhabdus temperata]
MTHHITISPQIINTLAASNEPWGIKDKNSCFIYGNPALKSLQNFSNSFEFEGFYENELPWDSAKFAEEFIKNDKKVIEKQQRICSVETHMFGREKVLSSYFFEKFPFYHEDESCIGVIYHGWEAQSYSLTHLHQYHNKLPASIMLQPPIDLFTQREWDIIFLFLQRNTRRQIGRILNIAYRTVESYMTRIYKKIGIHSSQQLEEYCQVNNFNHYIPERFLLS